VLARNVLTGLALLLFVALRAPLGPVGALTAFTRSSLPAGAKPGTGWVLTKVYFAVIVALCARLRGCGG